MNSVLLAIDSVLTAVAGPAPAPAKSTQGHNTKRLTSIQPDNPTPVDNYEAISPNNTQSKPSNEPPQGFSNTLDDKIKPEPRTKNSTSQAVPDTNQTQTASAKQTDSSPDVCESAAMSAEAAATKTANPSNQQPETKTPGKSLHLLELPLFRTAQDASQVLATDTPQSSPFPVQAAAALHPPESKLAQLAIGKEQIASMAPLSSSANNTGQGEKNATGTAAVKGLTVQENSQKSINDAADSAGKTATAYTSGASNGLKNPLLDANLPTAGSNSTAAQPHFSGVSQGKTANTEVDAGRSPTDAAESLKSSPADGQTKADNSSAGPFLRDLNSTQVQISASQTKGRDTLSAGNNGSNPSFEQILPGNDGQTRIAEQSTSFIQSAKGGDNPLTGGQELGIGQQIQASIHSSLRQGDQQITIRLNPPELGKVFIKFQEEKEQIIGILEASKAQTKVEIEQQLPQIIRNLADSGVQIKRLEVISPNTEQSGQQTLKDPSLAGQQDASSGQQDAANTAATAKNPDEIGINEWLTGTGGYERIAEPQLQITNDSINILI